ncbi:MAG: poly-beta-1,6 N-acetyl-D-glucosamine export porin PgaA [Gammaproteobacteria bacterium]|nr:poly-beta-1,6 N-acetyl-D-glucosamine export porin PgaA [Gammaproteobacteria bacterium]
MFDFNSNAVAEKNRITFHYFPTTLLILVGCLSTTSSWSASPDHVTALREQAVISAKSGRLNASIITLKKLHEQHPQDDRVFSDLIMLLHQAGRNDEVAQLYDQHPISKVVDYAYIPWVSALRDAKRFQDAQRILEPVRTRFGVKAEILYAMISAEANQPQVALAALPLSNPKLDADDDAHMAYVYRLLGQPTDALQFSLKARAKDPNSVLAEHEVALALFDLSIQHAANPTLMPSPSFVEDELVRDVLSHDAKVAGDFIILLRQAGRNEDIARFTEQHLISQVNDDAYIPWASALRDVQRFADAQQILQPVKDRLGVKVQILYAAICAETDQPQEALAALPLTSPKLDADDYAHMAYVYRLVDRPVDALQMSFRAREKDPNLALAIQESVFSLSDLNSPYAAYQLALKYPKYFSQDVLNYLRVNVTAQNLRDATKERGRLEGMDQATLRLRNKPLNDVLVEINQNINDLPHSSPQYARSLFDRVYVLRMLDRMNDAIDAYQHLPVVPAAPDYVVRAAADAYLAVHQPQKAAALYQSLLTDDYEVPLYLAYYDALIEEENYTEANQVLILLARETPATRASQVVGEGAVPNWERLDVDQAVAMHAAYSNHMAESEKDFESLATRAPRNSGILDNYASVLRWRDLPEAADRKTLLAAAYSPNDAVTRLSIANNAQDMDQIQRWKAVIVPLAQDLPDDVNVQKNYAFFKDRDRPSITSEFTIGDSSGNNNVTNVNGSRDREWVTRINTPWVMDNWRGFVQQNMRWADFDTENAHDHRGGAGVEWSNNRRDAWLLVSSQAAGNYTGVSGGWSQWLNDHWQYSLNGSTNAMDIPLRALNAGLSAKSVGGGIKWLQNESRSAYLNLGLMDLSDGNHRGSISVGMMQRILAGPHYITTVGVDISHENNSKPGGDYFNPANLTGESIYLQHQWITWRNYQYSWTQNFRVATGFTTESGYGTDPTIDLLYQHIWQLSRTWSLNYGISWGSQAYDGQREGRLAGLLGFGGVF